jgi:hypothetical protein
VVELPIDKDILLLDVAFTGSDPNHGERCPASAIVWALSQHAATSA